MKNGPIFRDDSGAVTAGEFSCIATVVW